MGFGRPAGKKTPFFPPPPVEGLVIPVYRAPNGQLQGGISVFLSPPGRGAQYGNGYYPPPDQVGASSHALCAGEAAGIYVALAMLRTLTVSRWRVRCHSGRQNVSRRNQSK